MENENSFDVIQTLFKLNKVQVLFANIALKVLNEDYDRFHYIETRDIKKALEDSSGQILTKDDISYTLDILEYDFSFIEKHYNIDKYKLTLWGKEMLQRHNEFILYLTQELKDRIAEVKLNQEKNEIKTQIQNLTIKQLKGSIFQVNKWWIILIINAFVTIIVSVIVALVISKLGIKN